MYREEHPNPQFYRDEWVNLNGKWEFEFDFGASGKERGMFESEHFGREIQVPFCPESKLSGIEYKDFMPCVWYKRSFSVPDAWRKTGRVFLHFGAVDYKTTVYINQKEAGTHVGGYTSFRFDITELLADGENTVCVCAEDDTRTGDKPCGKQSRRYFSVESLYTRTTGIWQTVWLEHMPESYIESFRFYPDAQNGRLLFEVRKHGAGRLHVAASYQGAPMGECALDSDADVILGEIPLAEKHLWEVGCGRLYDVTLQYGEDVVHSYFGLREVRMDGARFLLNGKSVFQRLVLDQGYYPDGLYTAPSEEALIRDIQLSLDAGFNGARLHQKVFEPRFLYHCDRMGYLAWGEYPNWGLDYSDPENLATYIRQWREAVGRDFNHPSIISWCPFNETWDFGRKRQWEELVLSIYEMTKAMDSTRPCIDTSGGYHIATDIFDVHDYEQDPAVFAPKYQKLGSGEMEYPFQDRQTYCGEPVCISEYGGMKRLSDGEKGWGYGNAPKDEAELIERYRGLTTSILDNPNLFGFCYTQLYDIEQEINGLYTYDRVPKLDISKIKEINMAKAAIED